jgi:hypothetical protein
VYLLYTVLEYPPQVSFRPKMQNKSGTLEVGMYWSFVVSAPVQGCGGCSRCWCVTLLLAFLVQVILSPNAVTADGGAICPSGMLMVCVAAKVTAAEPFLLLHRMFWSICRADLLVPPCEHEQCCEECSDVFQFPLSRFYVYCVLSGDLVVVS